jgi:hypothetical protein
MNRAYPAWIISHSPFHFVHALVTDHHKPHLKVWDKGKIIANNFSNPKSEFALITQEARYCGLSISDCKQ